jgi:hypothetical protein
MITAWLKKKPANKAAAVPKPTRPVPQPAAPVYKPPSNAVGMCEWRYDMGKCAVDRHYPLTLAFNQDSWISR